MSGLCTKLLGTCIRGSIKIRLGHLCLNVTDLEASKAFLLHIRYPDGHRIKDHCLVYPTFDPDREPIKWDLKDRHRQTLWGAPAPKIWFE